MTDLRLAPEDDLLHPADDDPTFNESRYYNLSDPASGLALWVRMGNRPNEGHAELTVCTYLPDGRVGFRFRREPIEGHVAHDAGGLRFDVEELFRSHRVRFEGEVCLLADPRSMTDPKAAFTSNPWVPCSIDLALVATCTPFGGEPEGADYVAGFARGHTEQFMASAGVVVVGDERFEVTGGHGWRDHSWGPRVWQSIPWYRSIDASFGDLSVRFTLREGSRNGFVVDRSRSAGAWTRIRDVQLGTDYDGDAFPLRQRIVVTTDDTTYELAGEAVAGVPLRNRRDGLVTRITSNAVRWRCGDRLGGGISEHLDQVVDGQPVGLAAGY